MGGIVTNMSNAEEYPDLIGRFYHYEGLVQKAMHTSAANDWSANKREEVISDLRVYTERCAMKVVFGHDFKAKDLEEMNPEIVAETKQEALRELSKSAWEGELKVSSQNILISDESRIGLFLEVLRDPNRIDLYIATLWDSRGIENMHHYGFRVKAGRKKDEYTISRPVDKKASKEKRVKLWFLQDILRNSYGADFSKFIDRGWISNTAEQRLNESMRPEQETKTELLKSTPALNLRDTSKELQEVLNEIIVLQKSMDGISPA